MTWLKREPPPLLPPVVVAPEPVPVVAPKVRVLLMNEHETEVVGTIDVIPKDRKCEVYHAQQRFVCARPSEEGWIYRKAV